ncbi:hypothetical protein CVT26_003265 [Gymnopilus dilepis]|uniref:Uncharacterized protein n=1 Tax=Gymnopilus dilepis TaxID=231916 RepID=A0A409Y516_9AGAR|nr:hypothetical protein CVT26_003265 [Gymnopilus dilepis]
MFGNSYENSYAHNHIMSSFGNRLEHVRPGSTRGHPERLWSLTVETFPSWIRNVEVDLQTCQIPRFWWIETAMLYLPKSVRTKMNQRRRKFQEDDYSDWSWLQFQENLVSVLQQSSPLPGQGSVGAVGVPAPLRRSFFHWPSRLPGSRNSAKHSM